MQQSRAGPESTSHIHLRYHPKYHQRPRFNPMTPKVSTPCSKQRDPRRRLSYRRQTLTRRRKASRRVTHSRRTTMHKISLYPERCNVNEKDFSILTVTKLRGGCLASAYLPIFTVFNSEKNRAFLFSSGSEPVGCSRISLSLMRFQSSTSELFPPSFSSHVSLGTFVGQFCGSCFSVNDCCVLSLFLPPTFQRSTSQRFTTLLGTQKCFQSSWAYIMYSDNCSLSGRHSSRLLSFEARTRTYNM